MALAQTVPRASGYGQWSAYVLARCRPQPQRDSTSRLDGIAGPSISLLQKPERPGSALLEAPERLRPDRLPPAQSAPNPGQGRSSRACGGCSSGCHRGQRRARGQSLPHPAIWHPTSPGSVPRQSRKLPSLSGIGADEVEPPLMIAQRRGEEAERTGLAVASILGGPVYRRADTSPGDQISRMKSRMPGSAQGRAGQKVSGPTRTRLGSGTVPRKTGFCQTKPRPLRHFSRRFSCYSVHRWVRLFA